VPPPVGSGIGLDGEYWAIAEGSKRSRQAPKAGYVPDILPASRYVAKRQPYRPRAPADPAKVAMAIKKARETRQARMQLAEAENEKHFQGVEVVPGLILGNQYVASNSQYFEENRITRVLNCSSEVRNYFEGPDVAYMRLRIEDSDRTVLTQEMVDECTDFIAAGMTTEGSAVLVHCREGRSRSPTVVIAYLMRHQGLSLVEAVARVIDVCKAAGRCPISIKDTFLRFLMQYEISVLKPKSNSIDFFMPVPDTSASVEDNAPQAADSSAPVPMNLVAP
jgi:protein-tyrosine phosphatase